MSEKQATLTVVPVPGQGAEDVLIGPDGTVYTGTDDGSVFAVSHGGDLIRRVASTGGRPLGLEWLPDGRILVCDARRGLLAVGAEDGNVQVLADSVAGVPMQFCNNAAVLDANSTDVHVLVRKHAGREVRGPPLNKNVGANGPA